MALRQAKHPTKKGPKAEKFRARPDEVMISCPGAARRILQSTGKKIRAEILNQSQRVNGAPEGIRTPDPQIRSLVLYPAELPAPHQRNICLAAAFPVK